MCFGLRNINLWAREAREIKGEGWDDFGAASDAPDSTSFGFGQREQQ